MLLLLMAKSALHLLGKGVNAGVTSCFEGANAFGEAVVDGCGLLLLRWWSRLLLLLVLLLGRWPQVSGSHGSCER